IGNELTYSGMNKLRAQRVIDLLPVIGNKLAEIKDKKFKHKDWKGVEKELTKIADGIVKYMMLSAQQKDLGSNQTKIIQNHFSKKTLSIDDLPAYEDYTYLVSAIETLN